MYPIVPPLTTGQTGPDVQNLQDILLYLLETVQLDNAVAQLPVTSLYNEKEQAIFGDATTAFVNLFKNQYALQSGPNELVNGPVAGLMNTLAGSQFPNQDMITVHGSVAHFTGNLIPVSYTVIIRQVLFGSNVVLASTATGSLGEYSVSFSVGQMTNSGVYWALEAVVQVQVGEEYSSPILYAAQSGRDFEINVIIENDISIETEFYSIKTKLEAQIGATPIKDITIDTDESQADFLARSVQESPRDVRYMVIAHRLSYQLSGLNPEMFYAMLKGNLPEKAELLLFPVRSVIVTAIQNAGVANTVQVFSSGDIDTFIAALKPTIVTNWNTGNSGQLELTISYRIYYYVLNSQSLTNEFLGIFFSYENFDISSDNFWEYLVTSYPSYASYAGGLKAATILGIIGGNNPALVGALLDILEGGSFSGSQTLPVTPGVYQPQLLGRLTYGNWQDIITACKAADASNFLFPDFIEGNTHTEKINFYAARMEGNCLALYTIQSIAARIATDSSSPFPTLKANINTFLTNNPNLDIKALSILALKADGNIPYVMTGLTNVSDFIEEIATVQRLATVSSSYDVMAALATDGLTSAYHITTVGKDAFVDTYEPVFGSAGDAGAAFDTADSVTTTVLAKFYESYADAPDVSSGRPWVAHDPDYAPIGDTVPVYPFVDPYADWRTLFGSLDSCACCHCESIYSPSAYFIDTLNFLKLKGRDSWGELLNRRTDLLDLELTCDNSDIAVPQIDIVNEMMEDLVSIGTIYVRQTKAAAEYQRAIPEYMNTTSYYTGSITINSPYPGLKTAVYPWRFPYNVYQRQIDEHLNIADVRNDQLVQRFSTLDLMNSVATIDFCRNYLKATDEQVAVITTAAAISSPNYTALQVFYGMTTTPYAGSPYSDIVPDPQHRGAGITFAQSAWVAGITNRIDIFLQQTQLTYTDLLELLDCYYINPVNNAAPDSRLFAILRNSSTVDITTCNLFELKIEPYDFADIPPFLDRLHRFVRLARLLGWTYYDLDIAMRAVASNVLDQSGFIRIAQLKYLADQLNMKVADACILFQNVEVLPYRDYQMSGDDCELKDIPDQYTRIFRNEALANAHVPNPFPPSPASSFSAVPKDTFRSFMSGVTQLKAVDLQVILDDAYSRYGASSGDTFTPSLASLSYIYRQSLLMRALKLKIEDWTFYKLWCVTSNYFGTLSGGDANNTAANPISILSPVSGSAYTANPYDAIRFVSFVKVCKNTGLLAANMEYILRDQQSDAVADLNNTDKLQNLMEALRGDLAANWYPAFDATAGDASTQLSLITATVIDPSSAGLLMGIVNREPGSSSYTTEEKAFLETDFIAGIFPDAVNVLATPASPDYLADITDRYNYVYDNDKAYIIEHVLKPTIVSYLSKSFSLDEDSVYILLQEVIHVGSADGFTLLLDETYVFSVGDLDRWSDFFDQFKVVVLVQKVAILANRFSLGTQEILYFWHNTVGSSSDPVLPDILKIEDLPVREHEDDTFVPGTNSTATFRLLRNLIWWTNVRDFTGSDINILFSTIQQSGDIVPAIAAVFRMTQDDVNSLIIDAPPSTAYDGILNIAPAQYQSALTYLRIIDCLEIQHLLPAPMLSLYLVAQATFSAADQDDVAAVIHLVKAPYTDAAWLDVITPVNDLLRVERRDMLVSRLLAFPPYPYTFSWLTSNDIFETLLVDVEMMPVVQTTRTLLAINATQIWMSRTLLGLEKYSVTPEGARQWAMWRKLYRVWEANRKIFIYPENWIEPELRDDKTELFLELERFLQQNDVTADNVEAAYKTYLERLDQLSQMDIIGMYRETSKSYQDSTPQDNLDTLHVFARTKEIPHLYYYRKRVTGAWTPWTKMEVQADGDHFVPVVWKGRVRLYWLVFNKDVQQQQGSSQQTEGSFETPAASRWQIQLAWTELKDGHWQAKQMSKESLYTQYIFEERPLSFQHFDDYKTIYWYKHRMWNDMGDLEKIRKEGINFFSEIDSDGRVRFRIIERTIGFQNLDGDFSAFSDSRKISNTAFAFDIKKEIIDREDWGGVFGTTSGAREVGQFVVKFNGASVIPSPDVSKVLASLYSHHVEDKGAAIDLFHHCYWPQNTQYIYRAFTITNVNHYVTTDISGRRTLIPYPVPYADPYFGYKHYPDSSVELLRQCPGMTMPYVSPIENYNDSDSLQANRLKFSSSRITLKDQYKEKLLTFPRNQPGGYTEYSPIQVPYFFYKDHVNTFFVEKVILQYDLAIAMSPSAGPFTLLGTSALPVKMDPGSATSIGLDKGIGTAAYDVVFPEASISWGDEVPMTATRIFTRAAYRFHNFEHQQVEPFLEKLYNEGLEGLLDREYLEGIADTMNFDSVYDPTDQVHGGVYYPDNKVDFSNEGAYSQYNWELFFHIPMLVANKLSQNQQFDEARTWYQYVFNPNVVHESGSKARFWNFIPFNEKLGTSETIDYVMKSAALESAVERWANNPFKPHLVARTRLSAYMKNTVMKYLDNLIAWGDNLFRTDSREAINEAALLYILALQILGRKPEQIPPRAKPEVQTYRDIYDKLNAFGNVMVDAENVLLSSGASRHYFKVVFYSSVSLGYSPFTPAVKLDRVINVPFDLKGSMYLFCTPFNDKLLSYWDILADRLFKIRNSQNIDGITRTLALYDPPIDPAILVKAAASGLSLAQVLSDMNAPLPFYRFNVITQKATELAGEVKALGGQLLSALEKKDAEMLALLRSGQELQVLDAMTEIKQTQVDESRAQWNALNAQLTAAQAKQTYYKGLIDAGWNSEENTQINSLNDTLPMTIAQGALNSVSSFVGSIPQVSGPLPKLEFGGLHLANVIAAGASILGTSIARNNIRSSMSGIKAGFRRRAQEWNFQYTLAKNEVDQMTKQMTAAEMRIAIAEMEYSNHQLQVNNARDMNTAMQDKYTNEQLYDWMISQVSYTYFQAYKLAYDTAKKAERSFRYELNLDTSDYIRYGYWDSLKKGLLAGESLSFDIKRMEAAYLDRNKRQLEITKHVSLAALDPDALLTLIGTGNCNFSIPEWLFDLDFAGQHMRRIKSVSVSIPCVAGPYTTISAKLSLTNSRYRKVGNMGGHAEYQEAPVGGDDRFTYIYGNIQSIATSSAQNDGGLFELNFRDERYLPFEGCGAISEWNLELPAAVAQFDYKTISDVILHIRYTAQDAGALGDQAKAYVQDMMSSTDDKAGMFRIFNLKQEFSNEWYQWLSLAPSDTAPLQLPNVKGRLPYLVQESGADWDVESIEVWMDTEFSANVNDSASSTGTMTNSAPKGTLEMALSNYLPSFDDAAWYAHLDPSGAKTSIGNCWMIVHYKKS
ncbi:neuraminidase-like domain-containing protein [Rurimicrobium arvi]|uniref:Virulence plasmid A protein n=1 Tax=Rurimicrobium arvi TaxID=2049916 RepID=A0ABP8MZH0_9BACT